MLLVVCQAARGNAATAPDPFEVAYRSTMASYYAALLASARGDGEGTLRNVIVLQSRWADLAKRFGADGPAWLRSTGSGRGTSAAVAATIDSAREALPRDVAAAHATLESVRALLREARAAIGIRTLDDAVTDYHDAMERLASHVGEAHEVTLTAADFATVRGDVTRARARCREMDALPDVRRGARDWIDAAAGSVRALDDTLRAAERQDGASTQSGSRLVKRRYYDLLAALARVGS
jgi:hypothetical protein